MGVTADELATRIAIGSVADTATLLQKVDSAGRLYEPLTKAQLKTDLSLNNVENTAHSTDTHTMTIDGRDVSADGSKLDGIASGADVTGSNQPQAHASSHEVGGGDLISHDSLTNWSFNKHIDHSEVTMSAGAGLTGGGTIASTREFNVDVGIADNKILQVDDADAADNDYAKFTAAGIEGRSYAEVLSDIGAQPKIEDVGSLPSPAVNGKIIRLTTDDRLYLGVG